MRNYQQARLGGIDTRCDFTCTFKQQFRHHRVISNRLALFPDLAIGSSSGLAIQLKLARYYGLSEVAFADEIWHDADFTDRVRIKQKLCIAQARFLFPEGAPDICKNFPSPNLCR